MDSETLLEKKARLLDAVKSHKGFCGVGAATTLVLYVKEKDCECTKHVPDDLEEITKILIVGDPTAQFP